MGYKPDPETASRATDFGASRDSAFRAVRGRETWPSCCCERSSRHIAWLSRTSTDGSKDLQQGYIRGRDDPAGTGTLDEASYRARLLQVKWVVDDLSRSLVRLSRPATRPSVAWFEVERCESTAEEVSELLERAQRTLASQREELRESFALIAASQASEQLTLARKTADNAAKAAERRRRFETLVQYAAAVFVLPALFAQVLAGLPDIYEDSPLERAVVVAGGTVVLVIVSLVILNGYRKHHAETHQGPAEPNP